MEQHHCNHNISRWRCHWLFSSEIWLCYLFFLRNIIMRIYINWEIIIFFTYHFTRINHLTVNIQFLLKSICWWRKSDNIETIKWRIISRNITIISFSNDQIHVHHIYVKYSSINAFILPIVCSVIYKTHYNPVIVRTNNLRLLAIIYSPVSWMITLFFNCRIPGKR